MVAGLTQKVRAPSEAIDDAKTMADMTTDAHKRRWILLFCVDRQGTRGLTDDIAVFTTLGRSDLRLARYPSGGYLMSSPCMIMGEEGAGNEGEGRKLALRQRAALY